MKSPTPEAQCAMQFQMQPPFYGFHFPNDISITQVRVNMRETEHDTIFETCNY